MDRRDPQHLRCHHLRYLAPLAAAVVVMLQQPLLSQSLPRDGVVVLAELAKEVRTICCMGELM